MKTAPLGWAVKKTDVTCTTVDDERDDYSSTSRLFSVAVQRTNSRRALKRTVVVARRDEDAFEDAHGLVVYDHPVHSRGELTGSSACAVVATSRLLSIDRVVGYYYYWRQCRSGCYLKSPLAG